MWGVADVTVNLAGADVLERVTLPLIPGTVTAIVGGDGAGKSTLLRVMTGRVAIRSGQVSMPPLREVGYQPSSSGVWRHLTVDENIAFAGQAYGMTETLLERRRREVLAGAGLTEAGSRLGGHLSGGMRQKLGSAMAMLHEPRVLLLDEPTTGVDPVSRVELWRMIAEAAARGAAVAMATTYLDEAERANQILVLDRGRVLASGAPDDVIASVPGRITASNRHPASAAGQSWRRGGSFHTWHSKGSGRDEHAIVPDLEDAVIALTLARDELREGVTDA